MRVDEKTDIELAEHVLGLRCLDQRERICREMIEAEPGHRDRFWQWSEALSALGRVDEASKVPDVLHLIEDRIDACAPPLAQRVAKGYRMDACDP